jgi:DNA-binding SARP family transcriptional activator
MIRYRLLGPLEAPADLPGGKPRALLARLLLDAGRAVPAETLVDSLWSEAPASAHKVLQVYISQLRKALGPAEIETSAPGYLLRVGRDEYDVGVFEQLMLAAHDSPDLARRAELLREALGLWRGVPLAEFRDEPFAEPAARRLGDLRLDALDGRIEAELSLGEHMSLVPELEELVEQEPLRERPRRQLMLALYRAGRQADALERYREGRRVLVEQLGMEPSPVLQQLEQAILRHDSALGRHRRPEPRGRGSVIAVGAELADLLAPLSADGRELVVVELAADPAELQERSGSLERLRAGLAERGVEARTASFTSTAPGQDLARLASEQEAELLVAAATLEPPELDALLAGAPCDVALAWGSERSFAAGEPVLVPFGGGREEWAALELGAWIARAYDVPLRLLGTAARAGRRDASRLLAGASLSLQRFAGTAAEPVLLPPGPEGILAERGSVVVASLPRRELDSTRKELVERAEMPVLLVRGGLGPSGLAPDRTLTRFSWSLSDG